MADPVDAQLRAWMIAATAGDRDAYESFLNRVGDILGAFFMNALSPRQRSAERVEELVQDVLLSIHAKRSTYRPELPILPWIYAIGRYRMIDTVRREARRPETIEWNPGIEAMIEDAAELNTFGALSGADLDRMLAELNERQRKVLIMAKLRAMPLTDVAKQMDMSLSAVKVTVHRALKSLQRKYGVSTGGSAEGGVNDPASR